MSWPFDVGVFCIGSSTKNLVLDIIGIIPTVLISLKIDFTYFQQRFFAQDFLRDISKINLDLQIELFM